MHDDWMKAAEKLLPIGVRPTIELDKPGQHHKRHAQCQRGYPHHARRFAVRQKPIGN
jgi:hypothetical protein